MIIPRHGCCQQTQGVVKEKLNDAKPKGSVGSWVCHAMLGHDQAQRTKITWPKQRTRYYVGFRIIGALKVHRAGPFVLYSSFFIPKWASI